MFRPRFIGLLLALVTLGIYLPTRNYGFLVFDDMHYVSENLMVKNGASWLGLKQAFATFHASNWHPLTWISHMVDCELFGLNPGAHHVVNGLFHTANAALLFLFLLRATKSLWPAAVVAALFAWHPLRVESVAWISERKDVLSVFFALLTLLAYLHFAEAESQGHRRKNCRPVSYWLTLLFFVLGLLSKPMLVTLPFVFLLLDYWPLCRLRSRGRTSPFAWHRLLLEKWPFFLLSVVSCAVTFFAQRAEAVVTLESLPPGLRIENAVVSYGKYVFKLAVPMDMAVVYPMPDRLPPLPVFLAAVFLAGLSIFAWRARVASPFFLVGWLWFLGTLVPVIGLVQVGGQAMADRYTYFPSIGIFIVAVFGTCHFAAKFPGGLKVAALCGAGFLVMCVTISAHQLAYWRDSEKLFRHAIAVTQNNVTARINLGVALELQGRFDEAIAEQREALRIDPHRVETHNDLANLLADTGRLEEAIAEYRQALRLDPGAPLAHANLGTALAQAGRFDQAMTEFSEAVRLQPNDPRPFYLMGKACLRQGRSGDAVAHFREALRLDANHLQTLKHLARTLASDEDPHVRNGAEAVELARRADKLIGGADAFVLDTLAMAFAEAGHFEDARRTVTEAIDLAGRASEKDAVAVMQLRLQSYEAGRPYREVRPIPAPNPENPL